jgi:hypothetical protein
MKDLLDYNRFRMEVMQKHICELEGKLTKLQSFCFEVLDEDCPKEYKTLVKKEIYNLTQN